MFNYGIWLHAQPEKQQPFRLPFHCGPTQARILRERQPGQKANIVYTPHAPNLLDG
jgi:hypothetical protein